MTSLLLKMLGDLFLMLLPALVQFHAGEKLAALSWRRRQILYGLIFGASGVALLLGGDDHWRLAQSAIMVAAAAGMGAGAGIVSLLALMFADTMLSGIPDWRLLVLGSVAFAFGYAAYVLWRRGWTGGLLSLLLLAGSLFVADYFILYAFGGPAGVSFHGEAAVQVLVVYWLGLPLLGWLWHTARRRAEDIKALRENEKRLQTMLSHLPGALFQLYRRRGELPRARYISEGVQDLVGISAGELMEDLTCLRPFVHPDDWRPFNDCTDPDKVSVDRKTVHEFRFIHPQKGLRWVRFVMTLNRDGEVLNWGGIALDVTEEKRVSAILHEQAEIIRQAREAVIAVDRSGRITLWNNGAAHLFGYSAREMEGRHVAGLFMAEQWRDQYRKAIAEALKRGQWSGEVQMRMKERKAFQAQISLSIMQGESSRDLRFICYIRDVTAQRQAEEALRASVRQSLQAREQAEMANRAKSEFLANMSHELRTPLNAIIGFSEILRKELFGPVGNERYLGYVEDIHASGRHLLELINNILDLSKIEAGKVQLEEREVDIGSVLKKVLRLVADRAASLQVRIEWQKGEPVRIHGDELKLRQVFLNIITNALKFTPEGGVVTISSEQNEDGLLITIADTGIGMSEAEIETALQPFGQVQSSLVRNHEGTGLGLPISASLIKLHGGSLTIESVLGQGTRVLLCIPAWRVLAADEGGSDDGSNEDAARDDTAQAVT